MQISLNFSGVKPMTDPKIYLAVDNCFASKRWTKPAEWMELLGRMGIACVEASADNECDPLYMDKEYIYQPSFWLGPLSAYVLFEHMIQEPLEKQAAYVEQIMVEMESYPQMFAKQSDDDTYRFPAPAR